MFPSPKCMTASEIQEIFHPLRVDFWCRSRLFLIRRRFRLVLRSDFVMPTSLLALGLRRIGEPHHHSPAFRLQGPMLASRSTKRLA